MHPVTWPLSLHQGQPHPEGLPWIALALKVHSMRRRLGCRKEQPSCPARALVSATGRRSVAGPCWCHKARCWPSPRAHLQGHDTAPGINTPPLCRCGCCHVMWAGDVALVRWQVDRHAYLVLARCMHKDGRAQGAPVRAFYTILVQPVMPATTRVYMSSSPMRVPCESPYATDSHVRHSPARPTVA